MYKNEKDILDAIQSLKPLNIEVFEVFETQIKQLVEPEKVTNKSILEELKRIVLERESNKTIYFSTKPSETTVQELSKTRENFYKTKIKSLNFRNTKTFFSPQFEKKSAELLKNKAYAELKEEEVTLINEGLQSLSTVEFEWKEYNKRIKSKETAHDQFKVEFKEFESSFNLLRNPNTETLVTQRAYRKFMPYKAGVFAKSFIEFLNKNESHKPLDFLSSYSSETLGEIISQQISPKRIFNDLVRISIKKAHEKLLYYYDNVAYTDDVLSLNKSELIQDFLHAFTIELFYIVINHGETIKAIDSKVAEITCRDVQISIYYKNMLVNIMSENSIAYNQLLDLTQSILQIFISSGFFSKVVTSTSEKKGKPISTTQLILPDKLEVTSLRPFKFPNIVKPDNLEKKDIDRLIKPLVNGKGDITKSNHLVMALNLSSAKPHKVNEPLLRLVRKMLDESPQRSANALSRWLREGQINIKTVHNSTICENEERLTELIELTGLSNQTLRFANAVITQLSKKYNVARNLTDVLEPCGLTQVERSCYNQAKRLEEQVSSEVIDLKYTNSRIFLAGLLTGFPIFITDFLCIRLRKYPREHWLSRTAGQLKHLLENFHPQKLTLRGLTNLLTAYYQGDREMLEKFEQYLSSVVISKKKGFAILWEFFNKNPIDFTRLKKPMYFLNLHLSLLRCSTEDNMTSVNVEVDQNASALVIMSLVLRSRKMARFCNVLGGEKKVSPYDYVKDKTLEFFENIGKSIIQDHNEKNAKPIMDFENYKDVIDFISRSREMHKTAIMCFCYNQTSLGRMDDFAKHWLEAFGFLPNTRQKTFLNVFAVVYPHFVEFVFPNTIRKLEIFKELVDLVCLEAPKISIRTLDGEVINWVFYSTTVEKRKYYDTVENTHKSFHASTLKKRSVKNNPAELDSNTKEDFPLNLVLDSAGMKRRFLSYLIHSIDASILRRIINKMGHEHKKPVNHLHDCIILHPNDLDLLYSVIKDIYSTQDIYKVIEYGVFDQVESCLSTEGKVKLNELRKEFFSLTDDFSSELSNINPRHMYSLED